MGNYIYIYISQLRIPRHGISSFRKREIPADLEGKWKKKGDVDNNRAGKNIFNAWAEEGDVSLSEKDASADNPAFEVARLLVEVETDADNLLPVHLKRKDVAFVADLRQRLFRRTIQLEFHNVTVFFRLQ